MRLSGMCGKWKGNWKKYLLVKLRIVVSLPEYSSTLHGRVAESTEEVSNLRPPRFIHEDGIIRPYDRVEAEGYDLFEVWFPL